MTEMTRRSALTLLGAAAAAGTGLLAAPAATAATAPAANNSSNTITVYLTRHGRTWLNAVERVQGWSDSPLVDEWVQKTKNVGKNLVAEVGKIDAAYSADMGRHFQTASLLLEGAGSKLDPTRDPGLREIAFGGFEGMLNHEMWDGALAPHFGYSTQLEALQHGVSILDMVNAIPVVNPHPELLAETWQTVADRMTTSLNAIVAATPPRKNANVLVVSSGLSITAYLASVGVVLNAPIGNAAVSVLTYSRGTWSVVRVNDTHYVS